MSERPEAWHPVEEPTPEPPVGDEPTVPGPDAEKPPLPKAVKLGGLALGVVVVGVAAFIGVALGGGGAGDPGPSWPLQAPQQVGDYIVGTVTESPVPTDEGRSILRATYADGESRVVLLMSRPETELTEYLTNAGVEHTAAAGTQEVCGTSVDTGLTVCGRMVDETGILMVGLTDQDAEALAPLLNEFVDVLTGDEPQ